MVNLLFALLKAARPRQWLKNVALFASITFTGRLFYADYFWLTLRSFVIFCAISSASYLINDIVDVKRDKLHPFKRLRPIASGKLPVPLAFWTAILLYFWGLWQSTLITPLFFLVVCLYILIHFSYSFFLKHHPVLDILTIASAYFIRVLAGEVATGFFITVWLRLAVMSLSLFLAVGKRRCELTLLANQGEKIMAQARPTLGHYTEKLLDTYTAMFANSTWIAYAFYTFLEKPPVLRSKVSDFLVDFFPSTLDRKWLMLTIPFVLYGIMRYMQLIYEKSEGESPEKVLLSDKPLLIAVVLWGLTTIGIIYIIGRS